MLFICIRFLEGLHSDLLMPVFWALAPFLHHRLPIVASYTEVVEDPVRPSNG